MDEQVWQHQRNEYYCQFEERWDFAGSRLTGGENLVGKRNQFILYALLDFSQWRDSRTGDNVSI